MTYFIVNGQGRIEHNTVTPATPGGDIGHVLVLLVALVDKPIRGGGATPGKPPKTHRSLERGRHLPQATSDS